MFRRFCDRFCESFPGCRALLQLPFCPIKEGEIKKKITKTSEQVAAPDCRIDILKSIVSVGFSSNVGDMITFQAVDLCAELGLSMTIEDTWGGDINTAAIMHLVSSIISQFNQLPSYCKQVSNLRMSIYTITIGFHRPRQAPVLRHGFQRLQHCQDRKNQGWVCSGRQKMFQEDIRYDQASRLLTSARVRARGVKGPLLC